MPARAHAARRGVLPPGGHAGVPDIPGVECDDVFAGVRNVVPIERNGDEWGVAAARAQQQQQQ